MAYDAKRVRQMNAAHTAIMAAVRAKAISPATAPVWARRAARGQDVSALRHMTPAPAAVVASWPVAAASLQSQVLSLLQPILDLLGSGDSADEGHVEYPSEPTVYDNQSASAITDAEADRLWPPRSAAEADHRRHLAASASPADLSVEELHRQLFGDTTGRDAGAD